MHKTHEMLVNFLSNRFYRTYIYDIYSNGIGLFPSLSLCIHIWFFLTISLEQYLQGGSHKFKLKYAYNA